MKWSVCCVLPFVLLSSVFICSEICYFKNISNTVCAETQGCTSQRSWGRSTTLDLRGRGIIPPVCFSDIFLFYPNNFFLMHFADKRSEPGQGHRARKGRKDLNTVPLIFSGLPYVSCGTCFIWLRPSFYLSAASISVFILKNNFRTRMENKTEQNNFLIFIWPPAVIMRLGVSFKGPLQVLCLLWPALLSSVDMWQISCPGIL